jgi:hypothetical protein
MGQGQGRRASAQCRRRLAELKAAKVLDLCADSLDSVHRRIAGI